MQGANLAGLIEFCLIAGAALGFGFWQLYSLKKLKRAREQNEIDSA